MDQEQRVDITGLRGFEPTRRDEIESWIGEGVINQLILGAGVVVATGAGRDFLMEPKLSSGLVSLGMILYSFGRVRGTRRMYTDRLERFENRQEDGFPPNFDENRLLEEYHKAKERLKKKETKQRSRSAREERRKKYLDDKLRFTFDDIVL